MSNNEDKIYDFLIIGSGFGGSISAMRLAQKGYSVLILEKGFNFGENDFPKSNWDIKKYLWLPTLKLFGIQSITLLKKVMILHGTGVGGGSLVYANTLMKPIDNIFNNGKWPLSIDWNKELSPFYKKAQRMLGVKKNSNLYNGEQALKKLDDDLFKSGTFQSAQVGVFTSSKQNIEIDPYFNGQGPLRKPCNFCGACMIGCPNNSKNTLDKNYLYFAQKWGALIKSGFTADRIEKVTAGYSVVGFNTKSLFFKQPIRYTGKNIIFSGGVLGTLKLLLKNKFQYKTLDKISDQLGENIRTNGESIVGATSFDDDRELAKGLAIGAVIHPDSITKIENIRYPKGSDFMKILASPLVGPGNKMVRPIKLIFALITKLKDIIKTFLVKDWCDSTVLLLVMEASNKTLRLKWKRSIFTFYKRGLVGDGDDVPSYIPKAQDAAKKLASDLNGAPLNAMSEAALGIPVTAHILGGCMIGSSKADGVIDENHEVFGYPGMYVSDGSVIPTDLGVNPSLTISAMTERFASKFKSKDNIKRDITFSEKSDEDLVTLL